MLTGAISAALNFTAIEYQKTIHNCFSARSGRFLIWPWGKCICQVQKGGVCERKSGEGENFFYIRLNVVCRAAAAANGLRGPLVVNIFFISLKNLGHWSRWETGDFTLMFVRLKVTLKRDLGGDIYLLTGPLVGNELTVLTFIMISRTQLRATTTLLYSY